MHVHFSTESFVFFLISIIAFGENKQAYYLQMRAFFMVEMISVLSGAENRFFLLIWNRQIMK